MQVLTGTDPGESLSSETEEHANASALLRMQAHNHTVKDSHVPTPNQGATLKELIDFASINTGGVDQVRGATRQTIKLPSLHS